MLPCSMLLEISPDCYISLGAEKSLSSDNAAVIKLRHNALLIYSE